MKRFFEFFPSVRAGIGLRTHDGHSLRDFTAEGEIIRVLVEEGRGPRLSGVRQDDVHGLDVTGPGFDDAHGPGQRTQARPAGGPADDVVDFLCPGAAVRLQADAVELPVEDEDRPPSVKGMLFSTAIPSSRNALRAWRAGASWGGTGPNRPPRPGGCPGGFSRRPRRAPRSPSRVPGTPGCS